MQRRASGGAGGEREERREWKIWRNVRYARWSVSQDQVLRKKESAGLALPGPLIGGGEGECKGGEEVKSTAVLESGRW